MNIYSGNGQELRDCESAMYIPCQTITRASIGLGMACFTTINPLIAAGFVVANTFTLSLLGDNSSPLPLPIF